MKILHIITGLKNGGAENTLFRLVTNDKSNTHIVWSLTELHHYGKLLADAGIRVEALGFSSNIRALLGIACLTNKLKGESVDVVQTWMYHADLVGGLAAKFAGKTAIAWNIRMSNPWSPTYGITLRFVANLCGFLSGLVPQAIICCAESAASIHKRRRYKASKIHVISNGCSLNEFSIDNDRIETEQGKKLGDFKLGVIGRWDPVKNYPFLLKALSLWQEKGNHQWQLIMVGSDLDDTNETLVQLIEELNIRDKVIYVGKKDDIAQWYQRFDVLVSTSIDEGFPNVVAESMCSGTPAIVSNVGDSAAIVGEAGWVLPVSDEHALCGALDEAYNEWKSQEGFLERRRECRKIAEKKLSIGRMIEQYNLLWNSI